MGQGLAKATEQVRARVRTGATLRPCAGSSCHLPGPGQSVQSKEPYTGSCDPNLGRFTLLQVEPGLNSLSRVSKGPLPGTGLRWRPSTLPTTSEAECATWCLQREGRRPGPGRRTGWACRAGGRCSQQGPEERQAQWEQEPWPLGPRTLQGGRRPVAETPGAALPDDPAENLVCHRPLMLHVGVGAPGGTAFAGQHHHSRFCTERRDEKTWEPAGCYPCGQS